MTLPLTLPSLPLLPPGPGNPVMEWIARQEIEVGKAGLRVMAEQFIDGVHLCMDDFARLIFDLWFCGLAPEVVTFDDDRWAAYMRAEPRVIGQVTAQLELHAKALEAAVRSGAPGALLGRLALPPFHLEVGSESGGFFRGYNVLHGTDRRAGGFQVTGRYRVVPAVGPARGYTVFYEDLAFDFGDRVDANVRWNADRIAGSMAKEIAVLLNGRPPKDYELHIKWRPEQTIICNVGIPGMP